MQPLYDMCLLPLAIKHTSQVDMSASRDFSTWINLEMGRWQAIYILDGNEGSLSFEFGAFEKIPVWAQQSLCRLVRILRDLV